MYIMFGRCFESSSQTPAITYPLFLPLPEGASAYVKNRLSQQVTSEALQMAGGSSSIWLLAELVAQTFLPLGGMANEPN